MGLNTRAGRARSTVAMRATSLLVVVIAFGMAGTAPAMARSFPIPSCNWAPASLIGSTFRDPVRLARTVWSTEFAPLLSCEFDERRPQFQFGNDPIVVITYAEFQRFMPDRGSTYVKGLGRCLSNGTCPSPHRAAWLYVRRRLTDPGSNGISYVSGVDLRVQDALNAIEITVDNPDGPFAVASEVSQVERLARALLPKFSWG